MSDAGSPPDPASDGPANPAAESLDALREILLGPQQQEIAGLERELEDLEERVTDRDALIATVAPVLGGAIRRQIRDARDEMIEALYPIIGQLVVRAVSEAMRDLARRTDAQVRTAFSPRIMWWRLRARFGGASQADVALREALPFEVAEVFLIHRETGLLLQHISHEQERSADSDIVSSMLTAIRDFAHDAFGQGNEGQLDEIEYGGRRILIEAAQHAYLAVVVDGVAPPGFRALLRERLYAIDQEYAEVLTDYDGDPEPLAPVRESLQALMVSARPQSLSSTQKRILVGFAGLIFVCIIGTCLVSWLGWQALTAQPEPTQVALEPTATMTFTPTPTLTPTPTPTSTPTPTLTPTATPTATPTSTSTPTPTATDTPTPTSTPTATPTWTPTVTAMPEPQIGVMTGNAWLRTLPADDAPRLGVVLQRNELFEILAVYDDWVQILWQPEPGVEITGWVPLRWVGTTGAIPDRLVTPTSSP